VSPDFPGYGLTAVPRRRMTYDLWVDCAVDLIEAALARLQELRGPLGRQRGVLCLRPFSISRPSA